MKLFKAAIFFLVCVTSYNLFCGEYTKSEEGQIVIEHLESLPPNSWYMPIMGVTLSSAATLTTFIPLSTLCAYFGTSSLECQISGSIPTTICGLAAVGGWIATGIGWRSSSQYEQVIKDSVVLAELIKMAYNCRDEDARKILLQHIKKYEKDHLNVMDVDDFAERLTLMNEAGYFSSKSMFKKLAIDNPPKIKNYVADYENFGLLAETEIAMVFDALLDRSLSKEKLIDDGKEYRAALENYRQAILKLSGDIEGQ